MMMMYTVSAIYGDRSVNRLKIDRL